MGCGREVLKKRKINTERTEHGKWKTDKDNSNKTAEQFPGNWRLLRVSHTLPFRFTEPPREVGDLISSCQ